MNSGVVLGVSLSIAALVGILGGLFLGGPALFADGSADERMVVVAILAVVLGLAGLAIGFVAPVGRRILPWMLASPTILLSIFFAWKEPGMFVTALLLVAGAIGFSLGGVWLGARLADRRRRAAASTQTKTP